MLNYCLLISCFLLPMFMVLSEKNQLVNTSILIISISSINHVITYVITYSKKVSTSNIGYVYILGCFNMSKKGNVFDGIIRKIGNIQGVILPSAVLDCPVGTELKVVKQEDHIIIYPTNTEWGG